MSGQSFTKFLNNTYTFHCFRHFFWTWRLKFRVSSKYIFKSFCQLPQTSGASQKIFLNEMTCLISWKISLPELVCSHQYWMKFSTYTCIQLFFPYHYLYNLLKCYYSIKQKIGKCHLKKVITVNYFKLIIY